nr:hypothetical protein [Thermostichus vulcanus]
MSQTIPIYLYLLSLSLVAPVESQPEIDRTLQAFAETCNQILEVARREQVWNVTKLHHTLPYHAVRASTGLKANHVCQALRRVLGNAEAVKQIHKFRPTSLRLDARTFSYRQSKRAPHDCSGGFRVGKGAMGRPEDEQTGLNHPLSKTLVCDAAPEVLTGIRHSLNKKRRSKPERRRTNRWAFYQLRRFVQVWRRCLCPLNLQVRSATAACISILNPTSPTEAANVFGVNIVSGKGMQTIMPLL